MENDLLMRKVPALASVERKLAGSRHLLDQASRRFGRMQTFMRRRMLAESREELARISSEAIVDILECEIGLLWCLRCPQGPDSFFVSPGQELDATARESLLGWTKRRTGGSGSKAAPPLPDSLGFRDWLVEEIRAEDGEIQGLLIAANSWQKGSVYDALDDASAHSFAAFGEQVGALMEKRRWILARGFAIRDESGKPRRMIGIHIDFTSFKQLEEKLRNAKSAAERGQPGKKRIPRESQPRAENSPQRDARQRRAASGHTFERRATKARRHRKFIGTLDAVDHRGWSRSRHRPGARKPDGRFHPA